MCARETERDRECVCAERENGERERDDERLGLNHISKFGMSSDQRTAIVEKEVRGIIPEQPPPPSLLAFFWPY